jgi:uncharacterized protein (TIGR02145 family)
MKKIKNYLPGLLILFSMSTLIIIGCDKDENGDDPDVVNIPTVSTIAASDITNSAASCGGNIISDNGAPVTARGVCWNTNQIPTVADNKTVDGLGIGNFESYITGLQPNTNYFVRAYATNRTGNGYGNEISFVTSQETVTIPTVSTLVVSNITNYSASSGGNITTDNGSPVTARGVCWSTNQTPTVADNKTMDGNGTGSFQSNITGLSANQTYYVRAYATNAAGTGYGSVLQFITLNGGSTTVTDSDGNTYNTVSIGTQIWLKENLKTTKYNDGTPIPHLLIGEEWQHLTTPAYTWYDDDYEEYGSVYGALYSWYVVDPASNGNKNVCPTGWHVPSNDEFKVLFEYVGGTSVAGGKLKETGTEHWQSVNVGATDEYGFTALGAGGIKANYSWNIKRYGFFWTTTTAAHNEEWVYEIDLFHGNEDVSTDRSQPKWHGVSVRCIKD